MATANINSKMLTWARTRSGYSLSAFASKCAISEERLTQWESGAHTLTFNQAMLFAEKAHIPFGYLFLATPPVETLPIPDLRTPASHPVPQPRAELLDLVKLMLQRQEWYRDYLQQQLVGQNPWVGRLSIHSRVNTIVDDIRQAL